MRTLPQARPSTVTYCDVSSWIGNSKPFLSLSGAGSPCAPPRASCVSGLRSLRKACEGKCLVLDTYSWHFAIGRALPHDVLETVRSTLCNWTIANVSRLGPRGTAGGGALGLPVCAQGRSKDGIHVNIAFAIQWRAHDSVSAIEAWRWHCRE